MKQTLWTLAALLSHWRRHPANLATLVLGLAIATALWSGVQALNAQARNSYDRAAARISGGGARTLVAARGGLFRQDLFVTLRRAGCQGLARARRPVRIGDKNIRLIGVEPLTLPRGSPIARRARRTDGSSISSRAAGPQLRLAADAAPSLVSPRARSRKPSAVSSCRRSRRSPKRRPALLIVDIGVAQRLLERPGAALASRHRSRRGDRRRRAARAQSPAMRCGSSSRRTRAISRA